MQSDIRVLSVDVAISDEKARTPLKFGAVVMETAALATVKATVENRAGKTAEGYGGIFLSDVWAWPSKVVEHDQRDPVMREVLLRHAKTVAAYSEYAHPIDIFFDVEEELKKTTADVCRELSLPEEMPFLGALVCASPIDAALHDAFGNVNGVDSYIGCGPDFLSWDLSKHLGPEFEDRYPTDYFLVSYKREIPVFHLVGGMDKLTRGELDDSDPDDGIPNCLEDWVARDGVFCLKVKLRGSDLEWDVDRTLAVYDIGRRELDKLDIEPLRLTADTNEQCESPQYIVEYLHKLKERNPACYDAILYVEQPTERDLTASRHDMRPIAELKPVLVDESLTDLESFDLAMELGWSGVALKVCKGQSGNMIFVPKAEQLGIPYAVQDLTNPSLSLFHSVGFAARINTIMGVEANSRQFFPAATTEAERSVHEDIFTLRRGMARTDSLKGAGLGYQMDRMRAAGWDRI